MPQTGRRAMAGTCDKTIVVPVYKNEENLPDLLQALESLTARLGPRTEVVFVVDGSPDRSWLLLKERLPAASFASQLILLSRNFGAFSAIRSGLAEARGKAMAVMAADLQEPPELIEAFFAVLDAGDADVVFGQRTGRNDPFLYRLFSNTFWSLYRRFVIPDLPKGGVDIFACNRAVTEALLRIEEPNSSLLAQLFWVGFRRKFLPYQRRERTKGKSAWSFPRRFRYMMDSIFSFTDLPVMIILWVGILGLVFSFGVGFVTVIAWVGGLISVPGYTTLLLVTLFLFSLVLTTQGILGAYLWRALENSKHRPLTIVQTRDRWDVDTQHHD